MNAEDGEFVPQHNDFQFLELVRPKVQRDELQEPSEHHVTERDEHEASQRWRQRHAILLLRIGSFVTHIFTRVRPRTQKPS
jgi:hypothetical protein